MLDDRLATYSADTGMAAILIISWRVEAHCIGRIQIKSNCYEFHQHCRAMK